MEITLQNSGLASREMFEAKLPSKERREKGPYAVMECYEDIPCDPCMTSCQVGAVEMAELNAQPVCHHDKCTGCTSCVGRCPGLACFVINEVPKDAPGKIEITFPYEMFPLPEKGDVWNALNREGAVVGDAEIIRVISNEKMDHTNLITMRVDADLLFDARNIAKK